MFEPNQFRKLIKESLVIYAERAKMPSSFFSDDAVELLMLTAAQESLLGTYLEQIKGPAIGVFQVEPSTLNDIHLNYLRFKPEMRYALEEMSAQGMNIYQSLWANLMYQTIVARICYWRAPEKLPSKHNIEEMAMLWKLRYNTPLGRGTVQEAIKNYKQYVLGETS